jgi:hypothetical protein
MGSNGTPKPLAIEIAEIDVSVLDRFFRRLPTERNILELALKFSLRLDSGDEQSLRKIRHASDPANVAFATLQRLPNGFACPSDGRSQPNAGNYYTSVNQRRVPLNFGPNRFRTSSGIATFAQWHADTAKDRNRKGEL